jgi:hypothetical protein
MASGRAWRTEFQNASATWPDRVRPEASVIVPEMMIGQRLPRSSNRVRQAKIAALALSVSKIDQEQIRPAVGQAARLLEVGRDQLVVGDVALGRIVHVRADAGRAVGRADGAGHEARALRRRGRVRRLARHARGGHVHLVRQRLHPVIGHGDALRVEAVGLDDVRAGGEVLAVDLADDRGLGQHQQVVVALEVVRPVLEALAAVLGLAQLVTLDHRTHGTVEYEEAAGEQVSEQFGTVGTGGGRGVGHAGIIRSIFI